MEQVRAEYEAPGPTKGCMDVERIVTNFAC